MHRISLPAVLMLMVLLAASCKTSKITIRDAKPISHDLWNSLLQKHVSDDGYVDYKGFRQDSVEFRKYLDLLSANPPNDKFWSENERKAFWINAYNAFTVDIVARNYPVASIKDISPSVSIPFVNTVWDIKFINIGGEELDLNNIEHSKLRKRYDEPRVHFAVVCASASCPILLNEAYVPERLDAQLDQQARAFLADSFRNSVKPNQLELSKIFSWYKGDFTKKTDLIEYISQYTDVKIDPKADVNFKDYDWSLNEKK